METFITYTQTLESGAVVVVRGVPARIDVDENGRKDTVYKSKTLITLQKIINLEVSRQFHKSQSPNVFELNWNSDVVEPTASVAFRFVGEKVNLHSELPVWEKAFEKISNAVRVMSQALAKNTQIKLGMIEYPTVKYIGAGSLIIGVEAPSAKGLFQVDDMPPDIALTALEYTVDLANWLTSKDRKLPESIRNLSPDVQVAALKAVEELLPTGGDGLLAVEVIPQTGLRTIQKSGKSAVLKREYRDRIVKQRVKLQAKHSGKNEFTATGILFGLTGKGEIELTEALIDDSQNPLPIKFAANLDLVMRASSFFARRVKVIGLRTDRAGQRRDDYEALDIELLPD